MPTADQIYQTYLKGPAALIRLFEQALGTDAIYEPPEPDMQKQRTIESLSEEIGRLKHQIARLKEWQNFYNYHHRPRSALSGKTPYELLREKLNLNLAEG